MVTLGYYSRKNREEYNIILSEYNYQSDNNWNNRFLLSYFLIV